MKLALLTMETTNGHLQKISANGEWVSQNANQLEILLQGIVDKSDVPSTIQIDVSAVINFDTFGAWLLERFIRELNAKGSNTLVKGMRTENKSLFSKIGGLDCNSISVNNAESQGQKRYANLKEDFAKLWKEMSAFMMVLGASITSMFRLSMHPRNFRLTSTVYQFDRVAWQALPIVLLVTFIIGAIIAQQGFFHFRQFGAELYVVNMVGFLITREIGVLLVAIVVAGRSGSSFTAELGSMKMNEEIDALRTMGFNPIDVLILPRILVLVIALPALTFIGSITALFGAGLVSVFYGGISAELYISQLKDIITIEHFNVGMMKAPFIGAAIGIIACTEGLAVKGSASSLGKHTTQSVVKSIFMVIFLDGLFALFFSAIRM